MRYILSGNYSKAAAGIGLLILVGSIFAALLLWQRGDGPGPTVVPRVTTPGGLGLPPPPGRVTIDFSGHEKSGSTSYGGYASDSNELENQRAAPPAALIPAPGELATAQSEDSGGNGRFDAGDGATMSDSVDLDAKEAQAPPPPGGPGDSVNFADSAGLVVRSASGDIKQEETVK